MDVLKNDLSELNKYLSQFPLSKKFILLDENTYSLCLPHLIENVEEVLGAEILEIEAGEKSKNLSIVEQLSEALLSSCADRDSILISLGGGVITDIGGFLASIYKRGIKHIAVPTTLLAMVDASIGGKTGVNVGEIKNSVGTFNFQTKVFYHKDFLNTLDYKQILNGTAEMIKIALVSDALLWENMKQSKPIGEKGFNFDFIQRCIDLKQDIVSRDEKDRNERKILNFGHSFAHAIETFCLKNEIDILHGQAVISGIFYAIKLSVSLLNFSKTKSEEILNYITQYYDIFPIKDNIDVLLSFMKNDKKNRENGFNFVLLEDISKPKIDVVVQKEDILDIL
ncbi:MAG: 3-dehydroquinate synthase [Bacteroidales bacterium]|jgi:3-dehydroquinate synthase|nr:3-dehydroquinate synthase [Bacteroidales bacterium]